jgi:hypothetical protein
MVLMFPVLVVAAAGLICSLLGCIVPFAALAAAAALLCSKRIAAAILATTWLINQVLGFTVHHYPRDPSTFAWGIAIGVATAAAYACARIARGNAVMALLLAFAAFEGVLVLFSLRLGDWEAYVPSVIAMLFGTNALWFAAIVLVGRYGFGLHAARR